MCVCLCVCVIVITRYRVLARGLPTTTTVENRCIAIMQQFDQERKNWQMGKTKVCRERGNAGKIRVGEEERARKGE